MSAGGNVGLPYRVVDGRRAMHEVEIDTEVQGRLRRRNPETRDQVSAVRHPAPDEAAVEKDQALSLSMLEIVQLHGRINILTP